MERQPLLSVAIITYNQKEFIGQAIDSVLRQKTNFPFELVIGDDCSTDGTREMLIYYKDRNPDQIRLILHPERNNGIPGKKNFLSVIDAARAQYVALLDGDDYWTDETKLQQQVDFLETHPEYSIACHRVFRKEGSNQPQLDRKDPFAPDEERTYTLAMMAREGNLVAAPSVVYRNRLFNSFPSWFEKSPVGDYVLHMLNARYGKIHYSPQPMAVYRDHSGGAWGGNSEEKNIEGMIRVTGWLMTEDFDPEVIEGLRHQQCDLHSRLLLLLRERNEAKYNDHLAQIRANDEEMWKRVIGRLEENQSLPVGKWIRQIRNWISR